MIQGTLAFIGGALAYLYMPPGTPAWPAAVVVLCLLALRIPRLRRGLLPLWLALGLAWCGLRVEVQMAGLLPPALDGAELPARVVVQGVPRQGDGLARFEARVESLDPARPWRGRARLSWYHRGAELRPGDTWHMILRLKRPRGFANPGTFDYERWLFTRGIQATGYPLTREREPERVSRGGGGLNNLRLALARDMERALGDASLGGLVVALGVGLRHGIGDAQWDTLRRSGTAHLMAISGLHVGLVAGLAYGLGGLLWRRSAFLCGWLAAPRAGALAALAAALGYALLAGFALPTQRAFIMVLALAAGALVDRPWPIPRRLAAAALAIVVLDPLALLGAGFWLSFGAVTLILLGMSGRVGVRGHPWWRWGRVHLLVGLGLAPVTAGAFALAPLVAPLANLVAVPWVGVSVVPLTLAGLVLLPAWPGLGGLLLQGAHLSLLLLWPLLERLGASGLELAGGLGPAAVAMAAAGVVLLFAPAGLPGRWLGLLWLAPLLLAARPSPQPGEVWVTLLDVGQGLAVVVRTSGHLLVYDTGPRFRSGSDTGDMVLVPYLEALGHRRLDALVVSHGDSDHAGGLQSLLVALPVSRVLSGGGDLAGDLAPCRRGQGWRWDGVDFRVLHPGSPGELAGNDGSCVLAVAAGTTRLILTGDLEGPGEGALVSALGGDLAADVLLIPHHGSTTSATPALIAAVAPRLGLLSVGHRNRWGFPHPEVVARLEAAGVELVSTADCGAITVKMDGSGVRDVECYRRDESRHWRAAWGGRE